MSGNKLYLFDFDGTISRKDSFISFIYFSTSFWQSLQYWLVTLLNFLFARKSNSELKEYFYYSNFKNIDDDEFGKICNEFAESILSGLIRQSFLEFAAHIDPQAKIVVVSASIKNYLQPWCDQMGFDLIATELEVSAGKLTGKFSTPNCKGQEKVRRIKQQYDLSKYDEIHVFGNSEGDRAMLALGTHQYYKYFG